MPRPEPETATDRDGIADQTGRSVSILIAVAAMGMVVLYFLTPLTLLGAFLAAVLGFGVGVALVVRRAKRKEAAEAQVLDQVREMQLVALRRGEDG